MLICFVTWKYMHQNFVSNGSGEIRKESNSGLVFAKMMILVLDIRVYKAKIGYSHENVSLVF